MTNRNDNIASIRADLESLDSKRAEIESAANDAAREADDASDEAGEAVSHAENAACAASDARDAAQRAESLADDMTFAISELYEAVGELNDDDDSDESELRERVETLERELEFERAKFNRIVTFIAEIAAERITLEGDDSDDDNDAS